MSSQFDLEKRIVQAQMDIHKLKATQIIGGDNMQSFIYNLPRIEGTFSERGVQMYAITIYANTPFPLVSVEFEVWEYDNSTWVKRNYPYCNAPAPYGQTSYSLLNYDFLNNEGITNVWGNGLLEARGNQYNLSDPRLYIFMVDIQNGSDSARRYRFENIKIRSSASGTAFTQELNWWAPFIPEN